MPKTRYCNDTLSYLAKTWQDLRHLRLLMFHEKNILAPMCYLGWLTQ